MTVIAIYFPDDPPETSPPEAPIPGASVHFPDEAEPGPTVVPARVAIHFHAEPPERPPPIDLRNGIAIHFPDET